MSDKYDLMDGVSQYHERLEKLPPGRKGRNFRGAAKGPSQFSMGRSQAKSLLTQKPKASVPLGGMNWGNILTRGGLKMLGVIGGIMSPRTAGAPSVDDWKKDDENAVYKDSYLTGNINTAGPAYVDIDQREDYARAKRGLPKRKRNRNY